MTKKRKVILTVLISSILLLFFEIYDFASSFPIKHYIGANRNFSDIVSYDIVDSISLRLDSATSPGVVENFCLFEDSNRLLISFINLITHNVYLFDVEDERVFDVWCMDSIGFSRNEYVQGFSFLSRDSIALYSFNSSKWVIVTKDKGKISQGSLALGEYSPFPNIYPWVSTCSPIVFDRDSFYLYFVNYWDSRGSIELDTLQRVLGVLDIKTGLLKDELHYPRQFLKTNWGGIAGLGRESHTFNKQERLLVISYMFDDSLIVYQPNLRRNQRVYAGSRFFRERVSLNFHPALTDFNKRRIRDYFQTSFIYATIHYDGFRNRYYRITDFIDESKDKKKIRKNSILVLAEDYSILGEVLIPDRYNIKNSFVSEKGLYLQRSDYRNDDLLKFDCFLLKEKI